MATLKLRERTVGAVTYLDVQGRIEGDEASALKVAVDGLTRRGVRHIALNLETIRRVDSLGLGTLILLQQAAERAGAGVCLLRLTKHVHHLLIVTRLLQCFEHFDSEEQVECWATRTTAPDSVAVGLDLQMDVHGYSHC